MQEITKKLRDKALSDFAPFIEQMAQEGCNQEIIVRAFQGYIQQKSTQFYRRSGGFSRFGKIVSIEEMKKADSKAERIFYEMLLSSGFKFDFQYSIGPYRVDYLLAGFIILELDGPHHKQSKDDKRDKYLRKLGYKIIRVPLMVLLSCPDAVMEEIREAVTRLDSEHN